MVIDLSTLNIESDAVKVIMGEATLEANEVESWYSFEQAETFRKRFLESQQKQKIPFLRFFKKETRLPLTEEALLKLLSEFGVTSHLSGVVGVDIPVKIYLSIDPGITDECIGYRIKEVQVNGKKGYVLKQYHDRGTVDTFIQTLLKQH